LSLQIIEQLRERVAREHTGGN